MPSYSASQLAMWLELFCLGRLIVAQPVRRQINEINNNSSSVFSSNIWIPLVIALTILLGMFAGCYYRRRMRLRLAESGGAGTAADNGIGPTGRGWISNIAARSAPSARMPRRTRLRRTQSQVSTTSLPVYMKEPGEQELVIVRGAEEEDRRSSDDLSRHSLDRGAPAVDDRPPPFANVDNTILRHSHADSINTLAESHESDAELLSTQHERTADPRGEAPAYSEAVSSKWVRGGQEGNAS